MPMTLRMLLVATVVALVAACSSESGPYLEVGGGSFIFNYRLATAYAGMVVGPLRPLPENSTIEVTFENPAGGAPFVLTQKVAPETKRYTFTIEPLTGIKANVEYLATVRLLDAGGQELQRIEKKFRSEVDQTILPEKPLTIGPGYTPNPEAAE